MFQKKRAININENSIDLPIPKQQKKAEALQELVRTKPNLKGKMVYFFPTLDKYFEGVLMYEIIWETEDILKDVGLLQQPFFLEANPTSPSIASILSTSNSLYWKTSLLINTTDILSSIQEKVKPGGEFSGTAIRKISEGLELHFFKEEKSEKKLLILTKSGLYRYEVYIFDQIVKEKYLPFPTKEMKRTLDEIINFIRYVFSVSICYGQSTAGN
ncbi:unnamed protein product [Rhizophagus irregularis]|uniref:Uncharacterized protein n=1 Tax=Rhizophagus irregularis TaxID=588596 RepID=A0A916E6K7_9GLOM|nr:unnamed protein product [Rhizophagus irregularis]